MTILLTGATGFVGSALTRQLHQQGYSLTAVVRRVTDSLPGTIQQTPVGDLRPNTNWTPVLNGVDTVIHLAARVHVMRDDTTDPLAAFRRINTIATLNLAQQAADARARRFIYLSSIKVNGENTTDKPFTPKEHNVPTDPYALSKYEAERGLMEMAQQTGMEIVIIRPPLVYGPGVKGNFRQLIQWTHRGIPLPLGAIHNQRSLVALDNLINLVITCINHPAAANQTFLISDDEDLSTTELLQRLGNALDKPACLFPVPQGLLEHGLKLIGKGDIARRLCSDLRIDISNTKQRLDWKPPVSVDEGLRRTAQWYLQQQR